MRGNALLRQRRPAPGRRRVLSRADVRPGHRNFHRRLLPMTLRMSPASNPRAARLAGIGLMLAGVWAFSFGDALGKHIVASYPVGQLLLLGACASLLLLA